MNRRLVLLSLTLLLIGQLAALPAGACEKSEECKVERSCETTDTGIRCTIKATGDDLKKVQECTGSCKEHCTKDGVTVTVEEIEGGIVVTRAATDPEMIKKLQAHTGACCHHHSGHEGCCKKAAHEHPGHDGAEQETQAKKPCAKPCTIPCTHD